MKSRVSRARIALQAMLNDGQPLDEERVLAAN